MNPSLAANEIPPSGGFSFAARRAQLSKKTLHGFEEVVDILKKIIQPELFM